MKKFLLSLIGIAIFVAAFALVGLKINSVKADATYTYDYDFITTDNGMNGIWATDYFSSTVTITPTDEGCFNVVRDDSGTFKVIDGSKSPGGDGSTLVGDGTEGEISGGITMKICGILITTPEPNTVPEDLRTGSYESYADKYFHRFFSDIRSERTLEWGWTFTTCFNGTWTDNDQTETEFATNPDAMGDITGEYVACQPASTPTPTPDNDVCDNLDGIQSSVPDTYHLDAGGRNCVQFGVPGVESPTGGSTGAVLGASTTGGQVLGATTLANTGVAQNNLFAMIFALGSILSSFGIRKFSTIKVK